MLLKGRHPVCKETWVDRVWKYRPNEGGTSATLIPEEGYGQLPKRQCRPIISQPPGPVGSGASSSGVDDANWEYLREDVGSPIAPEGEWDVDELMSWFGM